MAPTATDLLNDGPVPEGSTATVTVTGQDDPSADDLAALVYSYDFDDDGTPDLTSSSASATVPASFLADGPGTRTVSAIVSDDDGGNSLELTTDIEITNAAATATITGPSTATVGVPVTLKVGADDPSPADMAGTFAFTVDWGDGTPVVSLTGPADPPVTHTFTTPGTFTVTATATDPDGATSAPLTFTITVAQAPPTTTTSPTTTLHDDDLNDDHPTDDDHRARFDDDDHRARPDDELDHDHTGQHDHLDGDRSRRCQPAADGQRDRRCTPRRDRTSPRRHRRGVRCTPVEPPRGNRRQAGNLTPTHASNHHGSMKMHSPGHSSADSMTASSWPSGISASPSAPCALPFAAA